jgi:dTDP-4-dehydrorhamnose reductase
MDNVLIVGVDSVAGANCAVVLSQRFKVAGLTPRRDVNIAACDVIECQSHDAATVRQQIQRFQPNWIIFAGAAARSTWDFEATHTIDDSAAITWATEAKAIGASFTMLSSDAVFTGPWITHAEDDAHYCETPRATRIRQIEENVAAANPEALIVRTNVVGWSPCEGSGSFADEVMDGLENRDVQSLDFTRHASPIAASELARRLIRAYDEGVIGLLHIAGGERANPFSFALRLADAYELTRPMIPPTLTLTEPVVGFGMGETSLNCAFARELLGISMPLLEDSLCALIAERVSGHRDQLLGKKKLQRRAA